MGDGEQIVPARCEEWEADFMSHTDEIQAALRQTGGAPTCDDCLAARAHTTPEAVAAAAQPLADRGDLDREQGTCVVCGRAKIVNSLITSTNVPG